MIKQIVVHPKGATHSQLVCKTEYFLKCVEGVWQFFGTRHWINDEILNDVSYPTHHFAKRLLKPIGALHA